MVKLNGWTIAAILIAGNVQAGVYAEMSEHDVASGKMTPRDALYVQQGRARMEHANGKHLTIFRDDAMIEIDDATKTYRVIDKAAMAKIAGQMNDAVAKMQERMANMPPEQRAMMEKMMKDMGNKSAGVGPSPKTHVIDAIDTGSSGSANGKSCRLWNKTRDGVPEQQMCVLPASAFPGADEIITFMKSMGEFGAQFRDAMKAQGGAANSMASGTSDMMSQELGVMAKINGFPAATRGINHDGTLAPTETVLTKWQQRDIPAAQFEIPAGYARKELMESRTGRDAQ
jgi:hypothetical protein